MIKTYPDGTKHYQPREGIFYMANSGQTSCGSLAHSGMYFHGELSVNPNGRRFETPLGVWYRMTKAEVSDFAKLLEGTPTSDICEGCQYDIGGTA